MEYMRLMRAKIRQSELIAEARSARLTAPRSPAKRDRFGQRTDPSRHLRPFVARTTRPSR